MFVATLLLSLLIKLLSLNRLFREIYNIIIRILDYILVMDNLLSSVLLML